METKRKKKRNVLIFKKKVGERGRPGKKGGGEEERAERSVKSFCKLSDLHCYGGAWQTRSLTTWNQGFAFKIYFFLVCGVKFSLLTETDRSMIVTIWLKILNGD
jgi:hypothetical protein